MEAVCFSLFLLLRATNPDIIYKTNIKRLSKVREGSLGQKLRAQERHRGEFPGFLFASSIQDLKVKTPTTKKSANRHRPKRTKENKKPNKSQRTEKWAT